VGTRAKGLVLLLGLFGGIPAGASERLVVEVLSALGEPLLATLALPTDAPTSPLSLELQGAFVSIAAQSDPATPHRVFLRSETALHAPIVQGVLRVGPGVGAQGYPFTLFLDQSTAPVALTVPAGATLWRLANQWPGPPGSTQAQRVAALFHRNPQAFAAGDPNRLLAGAELQLPSAEAVLEGPGLASKPRLEVRPPAPQAAPRGPDPLQAELEEERAALAAALARAEADRQAWEAERAAQAAQLAALKAELARQQQALEAMQQASAAPPPLGSPWDGRLGLLVGAALAGLAGLAGLGGLMLRRREPPAAQAAPFTTVDAVSKAASEAVPGLRAYEPSPLVQRFGAQSLLSQRDWSAVLDRVERALAYGRLEEAEATLGVALEEDPHSVALRLQSLALAVEQGDRSRFEREAASLARGADSALATKLGELAERLPPPAPGPEVPTLDASFVLETPGGDGTPLAPEEPWSVEPAQDGGPGTALLAAGLALAPEGEGLDSTTPPPEETPRG
jgi:Tfp pilus assembly protein FimV